MHQTWMTYLLPWQDHGYDEDEEVRSRWNRTHAHVSGLFAPMLRRTRMRTKTTMW